VSAAFGHGIYRVTELFNFESAVPRGVEASHSPGDSHHREYMWKCLIVADIYPLPSWFAEIDNGNSAIVYSSFVKVSPALRDIDASFMSILYAGKAEMECSHA
jgi:hypothetical protein